MRSSPPALADVPSGGVGGPRPMQQGAVMMVYGLCKDRINAERLFNLFCLYGNVVRVSFERLIKRHLNTYISNNCL